MATAALLLYGAWAFLANRSHGASSALRAASTQGFVSFTITLFITGLMEGLSRSVRRPWLGFLLAAGGASLVASIYTLAMHWFMETPEIVRTAAPVLTLGTLYCIVYAANLSREASARVRDEGG